MLALVEPRRRLQTKALQGAVGAPERATLALLGAASCALDAPATELAVPVEQDAFQTSETGLRERSQKKISSGRRTYVAKQLDHIILEFLDPLVRNLGDLVEAVDERRQFRIVRLGDGREAVPHFVTFMRREPRETERRGWDSGTRSAGRDVLSIDPSVEKPRVVLVVVFQDSVAFGFGGREVTRLVREQAIISRSAFNRLEGIQLSGGQAGETKTYL